MILFSHFILFLCFSSAPILLNGQKAERITSSATWASSLLSLQAHLFLLSLRPIFLFTESFFPFYFHLLPPPVKSRARTWRDAVEGVDASAPRRPNSPPYSTDPSPGTLAPHFSPSPPPISLLCLPCSAMNREREAPNSPPP